MTDKKDLTEGCLESARLPKINRPLTVEELREGFCSQCKQVRCGYARWNEDPWMDRMSTQVDRLLENPNFADPKDPKWSDLRAIDFPDMVRQAIILEVASRKGDWTIPTVEEGLDMMVSAPEGFEPSEEFLQEEAPPVEEEPSPRIIEVPSKTKKGVVYNVTLNDEGEAVSCDCKAGQYHRRCQHLGWAEEEAKRPLVIPGEPAVSLPQKPPTPREQVAPPSQVSQKLSQPLHNTPAQGRGIMVGGSPERGSPPPSPFKVRQDSWAVKPRSRVVKPGAVVKITRRKEDSDE
jgi:hypothetical protein